MSPGILALACLEVAGLVPPLPRLRGPEEDDGPYDDDDEGDEEDDEFDEEEEEEPLRV
jgi:hypothetical protein